MGAGQTVIAVDAGLTGAPGSVSSHRTGSRTRVSACSRQIEEGFVAIINPWRMFRGKMRARHFFFSAPFSFETAAGRCVSGDSR